MRVITIQPTLAYKFNDRVSVGFGPTINRIDGKLDSDLNTAPIPSAIGGNGQDTAVRIKGDDVAAGFNLGVMVDLSDDTTWGATYHSRVKYELEGSTKIKNAPNVPASALNPGLPAAPLGPLVNGKYDATLDITLPESVDTSITHKFDDRWTGYIGATWTRWSRLKSIVVENTGFTNPIGQALFGTVSEELDWQDTWSGAIGASYQLDKQWVLRTGFAYDPSPARNDNRSVRIPVGDRKVFTLGAGYSPNDDLTIDVAYGYLWETTAGVNHEASSALQPAYSAKYDNTAHILGTQLTYRF
ncbi:putative outer membrane protein precursor [compost metagenome]